MVYTDGACKGNPGPGGWAWIATDDRHGSGGEAQSTNQRMEVRAVLEALDAIAGPIHIHSDSTYVVNCFNDRWYEGWLKRGWKNSQKKPVANRDLWEPLLDAYLARKDEIGFSWVKGHSGDAMNDRADELAVAAAELAATGIASDLLEATTAEAEAAWPAERAIWVVGTTAPDAEQIESLSKAVDGLDVTRDILVSGLRRGVELEAAERAVRRGVPVAVVLPFEGPASGWESSDRARFDRVRSAAAAEVVLAGDRTQPAKAVDHRNVWVVSTVVGAIVVGDDQLATTIEAAGCSVINVP